MSGITVYPAQGTPISDSVIPTQKAEVTSGSQLSVRDLDGNLENEGLLTSILKELKKTNIHLSLMTDTHITDREV